LVIGQRRNLKCDNLPLGLMLELLLLLYLLFYGVKIYYQNTLGVILFFKEVFVDRRFRTLSGAKWV
jgi:hypothetical protein